MVCQSIVGATDVESPDNQPPRVRAGMIPFALIILGAEVAPKRREGLECEFVGVEPACW